MTKVKYIKLSDALEMLQKTSWLAVQKFPPFAKEREKELGAIPSVISPEKKLRMFCMKWRARHDGNYGDSYLRRWLDVLQWDLQSMPCSGNVYYYNIDGEQTDVDNGGQEG